MITITAGLGKRSQIRERLTTMRFMGLLQDFTEEKTWIESTFYIRGLTSQGLAHLKSLET